MELIADYPLDSVKVDIYRHKCLFMNYDKTKYIIIDETEKMQLKPFWREN